mgnify:CR=1 FL=1
MTYQEQLKHPKWRAKREIILERDKNKCVLCHEHNEQFKPLQIHHRYYIDNHLAWQYPLSALVSLCESCHNSYHKGNNFYNNGGFIPNKTLLEYFNTIDDIVIEDFTEILIIGYISKNSGYRNRIKLDHQIIGTDKTYFNKAIKNLIKNNILTYPNLKRNPDSYDYNGYYFG